MWSLRYGLGAVWYSHNLEEYTGWKGQVIFCPHLNNLPKYLTPNTVVDGSLS